MTTTDTTVTHRPSGANDEALAPYLAMSHEELAEHAFVVTGQLDAVIETAQHWLRSEETTAARGYIAPFRYTLAELAMTLRSAIFWANWPARNHRDIFADNESVNAT